MLRQLQPHQTVQTVEIIEGRRRRRSIALGLIVVMFVIGNSADIAMAAGWVPNLWGPGLRVADERIWVLLSAGMFWIVFSMSVLCLYDLVSIYGNGSRPPKLDDLIVARSRAGLTTPEAEGAHQIWDSAGRWVDKHVALVGLIGMIVGALLGHLLWRVGGY